MSKKVFSTIFILCMTLVVVIPICLFAFDYVITKESISHEFRDEFRSMYENTTITDDKVCIVTLNSYISEEHTLESFRRCYYILSEKFDWGHVAQIIVRYKSEEGGKTTSITIDEIKNTDWENISSYDELKYKANIH